MPIVSFALRSHKSSVNSLDFCHNLLLSGSDDYSARIWDLRTSKTSIAIKAPGEVTSVSFWTGSSHLGNKIPVLHDKQGSDNTPWAMNTSVIIAVESSVYEYDLRYAESPIIQNCARDFTEDLQIGDEVNQVHISQHGLLAVAEDSGAVRIWDGTRRTRTLEPDSETPFLMTSCRFRSGDQLASGGTNCAVYLWDISRPRRPLDTWIVKQDDVNANQLCNPPMVHTVEWSPTKRILAAGLGDGSIQMLGVVRKKWVPLARLRDGHGASVASICFPNFGNSPNTDRLLTSTGTDGAIITWDLKRSVGGDSAMDPNQVISSEILRSNSQSTSDQQPSILFGIPHLHKANCIVSNNANTLFLADITSDITGYSIPLS